MSEALLLERLVSVRRDLHQYPELSGEEFRTTEKIIAFLQEHDIRIQSYGLETGVVAEIGSQGPIVALRADIDALPIHEETGLDYASKHPGVMHACGHDFHTASLLGAAVLLKQRESHLQGIVRLLFQPSEEKAKGAQLLIERGVMQQVSVIYGIHNKPDLPVGTIGLRAGAMMAAADGFEVKVHGIGTHAATPHAGIDPIVTASHIVTALQAIVSRNVSPLDQAVISVTRIQAGNSWNVISELATFEGTIRSFRPDTRVLLRKRFEQVVQGVATAYNSTATISWIDGPPPVINDEQWVEVAQSVIVENGLIAVEPEPSPAGEDFSYYLEQSKGAFLFIGTNGPQQWHHPKFEVDDHALLGTATLLANLAEQALVKLIVEKSR